jgi:lysophospholipase L1-like esterase
MILKEGTRLVMIGDSITDVERARPIGAGHWGQLGKGYPLLIEAMLNTRYPEHKIYVANMGISGNTSDDLVARWQTDVLDLKPDYVTVMIGVNDVWRKFDEPYQPEIHIPIERYRCNLAWMADQTRAAGADIAFLTPFFMERSASDPMRKMVGEYIEVCKAVAEEKKALFVDVQAAFEAFLVHNSHMIIGRDRVHPNTAGHMIIARAMLEALGYR